ncbi:putative solute carrier family 35 member e3 [Phaeomoniella chlamydospora]|uniref:Putative solute carrier family 35 member e3 n=1 Tax=Phaeomoniella chlamydospora TaxID=158046 RepID=A0A0G2EU21_PHACM|nr:putative solute carrier family 35 member e3 [Phaeomoniella chlamydospora]
MSSPTRKATPIVEIDRRSSSGSSAQVVDIESAPFLDEKYEKHNEPEKKPVGSGFIVWTVVNILSTIGIVFTNKAIFSDPNFRLTQSSFAAFHFCVTGATLYAASKAPFKQFTPIRARFLDMVPLALTMCMNVILPNLSLAFSTVTFYQIARILLTPCVALIRFVFYGTKIPTPAVMTLIPLLLGVATVVYYETAGAVGNDRSTSWAGVIFAFTGVLASSLYTVWIGTFQKKFEMNSMQLLLNQAPISAFLLLYAIPFTDHAPNFAEVAMSKWMQIGLSGLFASLLNISQFFIVAGAGPVSSTVVGHLKTCSIVMIGWIISGRKASDGGIFGVFLAIAGIVVYSIIMYKHNLRSGLKA